MRIEVAQIAVVRALVRGGNDHRDIAPQQFLPRPTKHTGCCRIDVDDEAILPDRKSRVQTGFQNGCGNCPFVGEHGPVRMHVDQLVSFPSGFESDGDLRREAAKGSPQETRTVGTFSLNHAYANSVATVDYFKPIRILCETT